MKKTLLTALLGVGLVFGSGNEVKGQEGTEEIYLSLNKNQEIIPEKIICSIIKGFYEDVPKPNSERESGVTLIGYYDKNKDGFYEFIKIRNYDHKKGGHVSVRLINEEIIINENTGLIDYLFEEFHTSIGDFRVSFENNKPDEIIEYKITKDHFKYLYPGERKYYTDLTEEKIYNISSELRDRIKNLLTSTKDKARLENVLKQERYNWYSK